MKKKLTLPSNTEETSITDTRNYEDDDEFFSELEGNPSSAHSEENDELTYYIMLDSIALKEDPLNWWFRNKIIFPTLAQLARKYLSIPATSVPSERLFSDANNHISAKRTRLSPELVNRILFLKQNSCYFNMFPPQEE